MKISQLEDKNKFLIYLFQGYSNSSKEKNFGYRQEHEKLKAASPRSSLFLKTVSKSPPDDLKGSEDEPINSLANSWLRYQIKWEVGPFSHKLTYNQASLWNQDWKRNWEYICNARMQDLIRKLQEYVLVTSKTN